MCVFPITVTKLSIMHTPKRKKAFDETEAGVAQAVHNGLTFAPAAMRHSATFAVLDQCSGVSPQASRVIASMRFSRLRTAPKSPSLDAACNGGKTPKVPI